MFLEAPAYLASLVDHRPGGGLQIRKERLQQLKTQSGAGGNNIQGSSNGQAEQRQ